MNERGMGRTGRPGWPHVFEGGIPLSRCACRRTDLSRTCSRLAASSTVHAEREEDTKGLKFMKIDQDDARTPDSPVEADEPFRGSFEDPSR